MAKQIGTLLLSEERNGKCWQGWPVRIRATAKGYDLSVKTGIRGKPPLYKVPVLDGAVENVREEEEAVKPAKKAPPFRTQATDDAAGEGGSGQGAPETTPENISGISASNCAEMNDAQLQKAYVAFASMGQPWGEDSWAWSETTTSVSVTHGDE